jgi:hypothetical protein
LILQTLVIRGKDKKKKLIKRCTHVESISTTVQFLARQAKANMYNIYMGLTIEIDTLE